MIEETTINIYPLMPVLKLAIWAIAIGIVAFLIHSGFNVNVFVKKDEHIAEKFLDKFPLVSAEFVNKGLREQNIENNQEIHEINKRFDEIEGSIKGLEEALKKAIAVIEELENRGKMD